MNCPFNDHNIDTIMPYVLSVYSELGRDNDTEISV